MTLTWIGPITALTTVATIWIGHVAVRWLTYHFGTWPSIPLWCIGSALLVGSLLCPPDEISAILGIVGVTTLVDGHEVRRQEKRIARGAAPENPRRPVKRPPPFS